LTPGSGRYLINTTAVSAEYGRREGAVPINDPRANDSHVGLAAEIHFEKWMTVKGCCRWSHKTVEV
jgi:hypothetical protein